MYIDSRSLDDGTVVDSDICIIGAGAAGITLARELANQPFRIVLIESGGFDFEDETDGLRRAVNTGRKYPRLPYSRLRYFGGTTNHWGGVCAPMRPLAFEHRPWIPNSGWPISRQDLDPYYIRAHDVIRLGSFDYDAERTASAMGMSLFPFDPSRVETVMSRNNALRFGSHYRRELDEAKNLTTYLWGNVVNINRHPANPYVTGVSVRTLSGKRFTVRARYFILATGGIENARMLLLSRDVEAVGLGNGNDLVGRFFMEHIWYLSGVIMRAGTEDLLQFYDPESFFGDVAVRGHIALPDELVRELQIPLFHAEIKARHPSVLNTNAGKSADAVRESLERWEWPENLGRHLVNILSGLDDIVGHYAGEKERFPALYLLGNYAEQIPNPDSRIGLVAERDPLGLNRANVHWQLSDLDKHGIQEAQNVIAAEVGRSGFGRMRIAMPEEEDLLLAGADGGAHHMGTTRMHHEPRRGVVDADCRIHGLSNVYIAGSSVFPTTGYINPTLTIVAMAIRLSDHLKARMNS